MAAFLLFCLVFYASRFPFGLPPPYPRPLRTLGRGYDHQFISCFFLVLLCFFMNQSVSSSGCPWFCFFCFVFVHVLFFFLISLEIIFTSLCVMFVLFFCFSHFVHHLSYIISHVLYLFSLFLFLIILFSSLFSVLCSMFSLLVTLFSSFSSHLFLLYIYM